MIVKVYSDRLDQRQVAARDGKPAYLERKQTAGLFFEGEELPVRFKIRLEDGQIPYAPGEYTFGPESIEAADYGGLKFGFRLSLIPRRVKAG